MAPKPSAGRAMLNAFGPLPTGPDDPRFMSIEDINKAVAELTDLPDVPSPAQSLEGIHDAIWAKYNGRKGKAPR